MRRLILAALWLSSVFAQQRAPQRPVAPAKPADHVKSLAGELKRLVEVFSTVERESAEAPSSDTLFYQGAIPAMLRTLDPHSIFFDPDQFKQLQNMERSEQKGFGMIVNVLPGRLMVLQALPGLPGAKASLGPGDEILAINNIALSALEFDQMVELLGYAKQKEALLHIRHAGQSNVEEITLSPALVDTPSVDRSFLLAPRVGYLRIAAFEGQTGKLTRQTIEQLGGEYLKALVIDLRGNPGGDVEAALQTAALFLSPDQLVFSAAGRNKKREEVRVPLLSAPYTFPVAILMNGKSASASEIVAGALQDHDRAVILGEVSYGKGLVQQVYPLGANSGLALTTAFYYTPSGRSIQKPLHGGQLDPATTVSKGPYKTDAGRLVRGGGGIQPDQVVLPEATTRLRTVIDATGYMTVFASEYARNHEIDDNLQITAAMLDEAKQFLSERSIQPSLSDWLGHREWLTSRLEQEILNVKFGVARGDVIEMKRDAVVRAALKKMGV